MSGQAAEGRGFWLGMVVVKNRLEQKVKKALGGELMQTDLWSEICQAAWSHLVLKFPLQTLHSITRLEVALFGPTLPA